jgi:hypothetical protein
LNCHSDCRPGRYLYRLQSTDPSIIQGSFLKRRYWKTSGFTCEDDGIGIQPEEKDQIFDYRCGKHTGIGLFFVREIFSITGLSINEYWEEGKGPKIEVAVQVDKYRRAKDDG